jgi:hypothetical protein
MAAPVGNSTFWQRLEIWHAQRDRAIGKNTPGGTRGSAFRPSAESGPDEPLYVAERLVLAGAQRWRLL